MRSREGKFGKGRGEILDVFIENGGCQQVFE